MSLPLRLLSLFLTSSLLMSCDAGDGENGGAIDMGASASCIANSPSLKFGEGLDQPSANPLPTAASTGLITSQTQCQGNDKYLFGAAKADITGPAGGKIHMGNEDPMNYSSGIHIRQYARSFVIASPCNNKRVVMAITDTGMLFESVRQAVLDRIAADPALNEWYGPENVMLSATHTHSTPGGQAHFTAYNALRGGHDPQAFEITVEGLFKAIKQSHENLDTTQAGSIGFNQGELLGGSKSRALPAYASNTEAERARYLDVSGGDVTTNRLMSLLRFERDDGREIGSMNWYAVHPTSDALSEYGLGAIPISGDNKGYAAYLFERFKALQDDGPNFIASFMQSDEGDAFTQLYFDNDELRAKKQADLPANEPSPVTVANGKAQLNQALNLYASAQRNLNGPIDYRFGYVQMDEVAVTDPVILDSLEHPAELDTDEKRTCAASMGISFPAAGHGAQPGETGQFTPAGVNCSDPDYAQGVIDDFTNLQGANGPANTFAYAVGCNLQSAPAGVDLGCQAEKPVLFVFGPPLNLSANVVPFQLFRIGNLAVVGLPWEITTMAGRRIRQTVREALRNDGVDYVVITGLANDYVSYLTTREEYALQMYEAASNQFGPWSLAAVQQEIRRLAVNMSLAEVTDPGPTPPRTSPDLIQLVPVQGLDLAPLGAAFGDVVEDAADTYAPGDTARVVFQASSPNSDLKTESSFLFVEKLQADDSWLSVAQDADPETSFVWHSESPEPQLTASPFSTAEILWRIPRNTAAGTYRIRFEGVSNLATVLQDYSGSSKAFVVEGPIETCP
ncbi:MAG: neutral/alkaline non-lysosomal ceramidase N-terminal domain-containing protein [Oceanococcus sp.]